MNVMNDILEKIQAYNTIIIHRHQNPDPDAIGSQVGLRDLLRAHFPQKRVLATGYDEPTLTWLAEMDTVSDEDYAGALVIVCDTANTPRIDDKRYTSGDFLIKIDHHPNDDAYGDLLWVDTDSSSTSELIALFAKELDLELPVSAARLLYAGLSAIRVASFILLLRLGLLRSLQLFGAFLLILQPLLVKWIRSILKPLSFKATSMTISRSTNMALRV